MANKIVILCDTNIIIEFFKKNVQVVKAIEQVGEASVYISSITVAELYFGAKNKQELNIIKDKLDLIVHVPINEYINNIFEELMFNYSLSHKLSIPDAQIAASAIYYDIPLYTLNKKDFKFIKKVKLYEP